MVKLCSFNAGSFARFELFFLPPIISDLQLFDKSGEIKREQTQIEMPSSKFR